MKRQFGTTVSTTQWILLSFLVVILLGSLLLSLPISSADGQSVGYLDALFTATSATCVTGLVTVPTVSTWSIFGQIVILVLIQIGGLGVVTILSGMMMLLHRKLGLGNRLLIQDAMNLNTLSGLMRFIKKVLIGTLIVESVGALLYMTVWVPEYGAKGIWLSVFNSVSAFCNAGIDIIAENSLEQYVHQPVINLVTCGLIVLGGLGYVVWWDVIRVIGTKKMGFKNLTLHSKIVIVSTLVLILFGAVFVLAFEYNNPKTIGGFSFPDKVMASLFQSVTTRTAGFATLPQQNLTAPSSLICILLMFIGGSPVGTAGGIKTVTIAVLVASAYATVKNRNDASMFGRNLSRHAISKAVAVSSISFAIVFFSSVLLSAVTDAPTLDIIYETVSATATVGLTRNTTSLLNEAGKIIIIATMYLGRVGPISLAMALNNKKEKQNIVKNPTEEISVGKRRSFMSMNRTYAVFGLGRYGMAVAVELVKNGMEVLAVDRNEHIINGLAGTLPVCKCADVTDAEVLRHLGIANIDVVIIAMADNFEASVMAVTLCKEAGVKTVIAKCGNEMQRKILVRVGADRVVFPESDSGVRLAKNLMSSGFIDMISLSQTVSMIELDVKPEWVGKTLMELKLRKKYAINVVAIRKDSEVCVDINPEESLKESMKLIVIANIEKLGKLK